MGIEAGSGQKADRVPTGGFACSFAKASKDKSEDKSEAALQDAFKSSRNALIMMSNALWFIFVLIAG